MKDEFVTYDIALRLKALGFDEPCLGYFDCERDFVFVQGKTKYLTCEIAAPTWQSAFSWFRDEFKYEIFLQKDQNLVSGKTYSFLIENDLEGTYDRSLSKSSTEKAQHACLNKLCEIVEKQKLTNQI